jgi:hypothetical protein
MKQPSVLRGQDPEHRVENVTFENVRVGGRCLTGAEQGNFEIDAATTRNIRFVAPPQGK